MIDQGKDEQTKQWREASELARKFGIFQQFQAMLSVEEMAKVRRCLISIERQLFTKN